MPRIKQTPEQFADNLQKEAGQKPEIATWFEGMMKEHPNGMSRREVAAAFLQKNPDWGKYYEVTGLDTGAPPPNIRTAAVAPAIGQAWQDIKTGATTPIAKQWFGAPTTEDAMRAVFDGARKHETKDRPRAVTAGRFGAIATTAGDKSKAGKPQSGIEGWVAEAIPKAQKALGEATEGMLVGSAKLADEAMTPLGIPLLAAMMYAPPAVAVLAGRTALAAQLTGLTQKVPEVLSNPTPKAIGELIPELATTGLMAKEARAWKGLSPKLKGKFIGWISNLAKATEGGTGPVRTLHDGLKGLKWQMEGQPLPTTKTGSSGVGPKPIPEVENATSKQRGIPAPPSSPAQRQLPAPGRTTPITPAELAAKVFNPEQGGGASPANVALMRELEGLANKPSWELERIAAKAKQDAEFGGTRRESAKDKKDAAPPQRRAEAELARRRAEKIAELARLKKEHEGHATVPPGWKESPDPIRMYGDSRPGSAAAAVYEAATPPSQRRLPPPDIQQPGKPPYDITVDPSGARPTGPPPPAALPPPGAFTSGNYMTAAQAAKMSEHFGVPVERLQQAMKLPEEDLVRTIDALTGMQSRMAQAAAQPGAQQAGYQTALKEVENLRSALMQIVQERYSYGRGRKAPGAPPATRGEAPPKN